MAFRRGQPCLATCLPEAGSGDESELDRFSEKGTHFFSSASNSFGLDSGPKGSETLSHLISRSHHSNPQPPTAGDPKGDDRREKRGDSTLQGLGSYCPLSAGKPSLASSARTPCRASATCHLHRDQGACCMPRQVGPPVPRLQGSAPVSSGVVSLSRSLPIPTPHAGQGCSALASGLYVPEANLLQLQNFPHKLKPAKKYIYISITHSVLLTGGENTHTN